MAHNAERNRTDLLCRIATSPAAQIHLLRQEQQKYAEYANTNHYGGKVGACIYLAAHFPGKYPQAEEIAAQVPKEKWHGYLQHEEYMAIESRIFRIEAIAQGNGEDILKLDKMMQEYGTEHRG